MSRSRPFRAWWLLPLGTLSLLLILVWARRPDPFTTGDGLHRYLPLIKAHTDSLLGGHPLRVLWSLGAGWSPAESAEMGVAYPPYLIANLLSRLLGQPLLLLEVSAVLHLLASGLIAWWLLPDRWQGLERGLLGALLALMPGPWLLGYNWAPYLSAYPWFLGLMLWMRRGPGPASRSWRWGVLVLSLGHLWAGHLQMVLLGTAFLILREALDSPDLGDRGARLLVLGLAQLPALPFIVRVFQLQASLPAEILGGRGAAGLVEGAQTVGVVSQGLFLGNLWPCPGFQILGDWSWTGVGLFFMPWLPLALWGAVRGRRWGSLAVILGVLVLAAGRSFPALGSHLGWAFPGFRWTWKLMLFLGPLVALEAAGVLTLKRPWLRAGMAVAVVSCLAVNVRGSDFLAWGEGSRYKALGARGLLKEAETCLERAGVKPGTRVALVDPEDGDSSLPWKVLIGNTPPLLGLEGAMLFEPLEPEEHKRAHLGLGLLDPQDYLAQVKEWDELLASEGIGAIVSPIPMFPPGEATLVTDRLGGKTWVKHLVVRLPGPTPLAMDSARGLVGLTREAGGSLLTRTPVAGVPKLLSPRPVTWEPLREGRWRAKPLVHSLNLWCLGVGTLLLAGVGLTWPMAWRRTFTAEGKPAFREGA